LWASKELDATADRSEAIRRLVEAGLKASRRNKRNIEQQAAPQVSRRSFEFLQMAEQFFGGYMLIPNRHPLDYARYFLFCHSIEVGLKAFVLCVGETEERLRIDFGHNIARLLREAKSRGLGITDDEVRLLSYFDEPHQNYWSRYPRDDWSAGGIVVVKPFESQALKVLDAISTAIYGAPMIRSW
jgi:hypothetical protein